MNRLWANPKSEGQRPKEISSRTPESEAPCRCGDSDFALRPSFGSWPLRFVILVLLLGLFFGATSYAQYAIPWSKIAGGGGTSTGGVYSVTGTIGQPDAGTTMTNGVYALTGGYWSLVQVVQTPGAPHLTMTFTVTNTAVVAWPTSSSTDFVLQQAADLTAPNWTAAPTPQDDGTNKRLVVDPPVGTRFYRLFKP
jgi:hypothetical protein